MKGSIQLHVQCSEPLGCPCKDRPGRGADSVKCDVTLDPGLTLNGVVVGPDGKPLAGVRGYGISDREREREPMKTPSFTVRGFSRSIHASYFSSMSIRG